MMQFCPFGLVCVRCLHSTGEERGTVRESTRSGPRGSQLTPKTRPLPHAASATLATSVLWTGV